MNKVRHVENFLAINYAIFLSPITKNIHDIFGRTRSESIDDYWLPSSWVVKVTKFGCVVAQ